MRTTTELKKAIAKFEAMAKDESRSPGSRLKAVQGIANLKNQHAAGMKAKAK